MALRPEQKAEYARRQRNYKRTLCDDPTWKGLRPHAKAHEASRAKFSGMIIKDYVRHPHPLGLDAMPEKGWRHSQGKPHGENVEAETGSKREAAQLQEIADRLEQERWFRLAMAGKLNQL